MAPSPGARRLAGGASGAEGGPCTHEPTLLEVSGDELAADPKSLLVEAFGNATLLVRCRSLEEVGRAVQRMGGSLAASVYSARDGGDDRALRELAPLLAARAGRIVENRMTTGLSVVPSMQHGGPWPSAGPPFFSAVGMPWTVLRFARRVCFDGWSQDRLPEVLRDRSPAGSPWRFIDGVWTRGDAPEGGQSSQSPSAIRSGV